MEQVKEDIINRTRWIDIAKGITILLMVLGHTSIPKFASNFIFAFHMPLFFITSGWCSNWGKYTWVEYVERKVKSLIVPFIIYSIIVLTIMILTNRITFVDWLYKGWGDGYALWFIPVLFFSSVICRGLYSLKNSYIRWAALLLLLLIGIYYSRNRILLPWCISSVPCAVFFIALGSEMKKKHVCFEKPRLIMMILAVLIVGITSHFWRLNICYNIILPFIPLFIGAISGTIFVFMLSVHIERYSEIGSKLFCNIGKETFVIVAFSQILIILFNMYIPFLASNTVVKYTALILILIILVLVKNTIVKLYHLGLNNNYGEKNL